MRATAAAAVALAVATACGGGGGTAAPTTTTPAYAPAGFVGFGNPIEHFSIAVPAQGWRVVTSADPNSAPLFDELSRQNPAVGSLSRNGTKFFAIGPNASVNVVVRPLPGATDGIIPAQVPQLKVEYRALGADIPDSTPITVGGHQAMQIHVQFKVTGAKGVVATVRTTQTLVGANERLYIVSTSGTSADLPAVIASFRTT